MIDDLYKEAAKAFSDAEVPTENRWMLMSHRFFIENGGTEEEWQKLLQERENG